MLAEERWREILTLVEERRSVTVPELMAYTGGSESTIRRDLMQLAKLGRLNKVHGGATAIDSHFVMSDQATMEKTLLHRREKQAIAAYAVTLIRPDDFVYLDAGSSTEMLAEQITETAATYVTNSLVQAGILSTKGCRVHMLGGTVKGISDAVVGSEAVLSLQKYYFTIGFFGTNGVTDTCGFTTPEMDEAAVKSCAMEHTKKKYMLCDSSKFSMISPVRFAGFEDAVIITDSLPDEKYRHYHHIVEVDRK
ncbi:MAG: DeoR/GlpR family DNA-binding transcription regulator [Lachnospiraceae bacterium]|nr:DeoR/GlpR family DNA-binding transcription regulator [Lachnospiraceae bacterium]